MKRLRRLMWLVAILAGLPLAGDRAVARGRSSAASLAFPGKAWSLVVDLPGCKMKRPQVYDEGTGVVIEGLNKKTGMNVSIFMEKAPRPGDARVCRDFYWKRLQEAPLPMHTGKVRFTVRADKAIIDSVDPDFMGTNVGRKNVNAYMSHDGVWVDIHLSMLPYTAQDARLFEEILGSVRIVKTAATRD